METALQKIEDRYPVMAGDPGAMIEAIEENLGGEGISAFELPRAKVPSGGGIAWEVDDLGEEDAVRELEGVIIFHRKVRSYWEKSIEEGGGGTQPDCSSDDSLTGVGNPGGDCDTCPFAQFGSARPRPGKEVARAQACQQRHQVFLLPPGDMLPTLVSLPPSSLKAMKRYLLGRAAKAERYDQRTVRLKLKKGTNKDGIEYSVVAPSPGDPVSGEALEHLRAYTAGLRPSLEQVREDVEPA